MSTLPAPKPRKKRAPKAKVGATAARTLDLKAKAFELLLQGHKCPAIGEALGVSRQRAWQYAKEYLAELKAETLEDVAEWRALLTSEHLDNLAFGKRLRAGTPDAPFGDPKGADVIDKALSQLKGLWIPSLPTSVKTELTGANGGPLRVQASQAPDLTQLTDEQLAQLENILSSVTPSADAPLQVA